MKTKRVFSLASLFLAGVAVCGCQNSNQTAPVRQPPWATSQGRTIQPGTQPGMVTQNGTISPNGMGASNGMVMQNGAGGVPQYTTTGGATGGMPGSGYNSGVTPSGGLGTTPSSAFPNTSKFGPTSSVQPGNYNPSMGNTGMGGGMSMTQTQYQNPTGYGTTGDPAIQPPPPTSTLPTH
jgi:hypothetical protein